MSDGRLKLMGYMLNGAQHIKNRFYTKPQSLGEGLQRVLNKYGAKGEASIMPGSRIYEKGVEFNLSPKYQMIGSDGIMSQLRIHHKKGQTIVERNVVNNIIGTGKFVTRSVYEKVNNVVKMMGFGL